MTLKVRIADVKIQGYYFPGYEGLFWHSGEFWLNEEKVKKVYNNGSLSILLYGSSKKSIKQLRGIAQPCTITIVKEKTPF
jgi:hypothetical protein